MSAPSATETSFPPLPGPAVPVALHEQVAQRIRALISSGQWPAHFRLKPEPELASMMGVSRGTLRRAMLTLTGEGLLVQVRGRGTYVTSTVLEPALAERLTGLSEAFAAQNAGWHSDVLAGETAPAPPAVAGLLDIAPGTPVFCLTRRGGTAAGPAAYLVNYVRLDLAPGISGVDFATAGLFDTLERRFKLRIGSGRRTFTAVAAPAPVSAALGLDRDSPVQYLQQVTYLTDGRPAEYSDVWIDSGKLRVTAVLSRH